MFDFFLCGAMTFGIAEVTFGIGGVVFTLVFPVPNRVSDVAGTQ